MHIAYVIKVVVSAAQHLDQSSEEQDVSTQVQLQLLAVVLHRKHTGQGNTETDTDFLGLRETPTVCLSLEL